MELDFNKFMSHYMSERLGRPVVISNKMFKLGRYGNWHASFHYIDDDERPINKSDHPLYYDYCQGLYEWRRFKFRSQLDDEDILSELESEEKMYENKRMKMLRASLAKEERERRIRRERAYRNWFKWLCDTAKKSKGKLRMMKSKMAVTVAGCLLDEYGIRLNVPETIESWATEDDRLPDYEVNPYDHAKHIIHEDLSEDGMHLDGDEEEYDGWMNSVFQFDDVPKGEKKKYKPLCKRGGT